MTDAAHTPDVDQLMAIDLAALDEDAALNCVGLLIDAAADHARADGTAHALKALDELTKRPLRADNRATIHYYRANAWHNRGAEEGALQSWAWEQPALQEEILELRRAVRHAGFADIPRFRQWQIRTNLGSKLSVVGRTIEAIELWDGVLAEEPRFGKAAGNRGQAFMNYARGLDDTGHAGALLAEAHASLSRAVAPGTMHEADMERVIAFYQGERASIEGYLDVEAARELTRREFPLGTTPEEIGYRRWCLNERLFLNPLNDLGSLSIAAADVIMLPGVTESSPSAMPPPIFGYFNQMKQEFVSARYTLYRGLTASEPHYSDKDVKLINTLDYPAYGLATERVRMAFRAAYSILDKVAFFLNAYTAFGHKDLHRVSFRGVWYKGLDRKNGLVARLAQHPNHAMRGLFWLSKDFYEDEFKNVTDPDAEEMAHLRNQLEHRYLQLHDMGAGQDESHSAQPGLRFSVAREDFNARTLKLFRYARAALIYLCISVQTEERMRRTSDGPGLTVPMLLDTWDDDWKR
ncbi:MAG: LA2681 family HEPN domain-containing protein [Hyphomonadaceae bacterium]